MDICLEPYRRDTFPAIALAAVYLIDKKGISRDESVAVCIDDSYVENSYFGSVKALTEIASKEENGLFLMEIEPTYPSEKYGYIIPEDSGNFSNVSEFKEKPDAQTAQKYLDISTL